MNKKKRDDIISASEIGQFYFCSKAWHLQKQGYKPKSKNLEIGLKKHKEIGKILDKTNKDLEKSKIISKIAYIIIFLAFLVLIFEVII